MQITSIFHSQYECNWYSFISFALYMWICMSIDIWSNDSFTRFLHSIRVEEQKEIMISNFELISQSVGWWNSAGYLLHTMKSTKFCVLLLNLNLVRRLEDCLYTSHSMDRDIRQIICRLDQDQFHFSIRKKTNFLSSKTKIVLFLFYLKSKSKLFIEMMIFDCFKFSQRRIFVNIRIGREQRRNKSKTNDTWLNNFADSCFANENWVILMFESIVSLNENIERTFQCRWIKFEINLTEIFLFETLVIFIDFFQFFSRLLQRPIVGDEFLFDLLRYWIIELIVNMISFHLSMIDCRHT